MFRLAGHAVAVANAEPDALAAAWAVTESMADDGFSHELRRLGLVSQLAAGDATPTVL